MNSSIPEAAASSTAYWMSGLSTTGNISLGIDLVAGRMRVPSPATGKTALRILGGILLARLALNSKRHEEGGARAPALVARAAVNGQARSTRRAAGLWPG